MKNQGFTNRIKILIRINGGDTDKGFANFLGLGQTTVFRWRNGDSLPDGASCILIAQKCKVSIDWLLTGEGSMEKEKPPEQQQPPGPGISCTTPGTTAGSARAWPTCACMICGIRQPQTYWQAARISGPCAPSWAGKRYKWPCATRTRMNRSSARLLPAWSPRPRPLG